MKRFLKEAGGVDLYANVTISWIRHHNPELTVIYDTGQRKTIDLSKYNYHGLHKLFASYFGRPRSERRSGRALSDDRWPDHSNASANELNLGIAMPNDATSLSPESLGRMVADERQHSLWSITQWTSSGVAWLPPLLLAAGLLVVACSRTATRRSLRRGASKTDGASAEGKEAPCHVA